MKTLEVWGRVCPAEDHVIASSYVAKHMIPEAIARADDAAHYFDRVPRLVAARAEAYAAAGRPAEARQALAELEGMAEESYVDPLLLALVYTTLGDRDEAFEMLNRAWEARSPWLTVIGVDPKLDPLRDDPRFHELLQRIGLETDRSPRS